MILQFDAVIVGALLNLKPVPKTKNNRQYRYENDNSNKQPR